MNDTIRENPASAAFAVWAGTPDFANAYDWLDNDKDAGGSGDPRRGSLWGAYHAGWSAANEYGKTHFTFSVDAKPIMDAIAAISPSIYLVLAERERQVHEEGWTAEHDATHIGGELALAAACYLAHPTMGTNRPLMSPVPLPEYWPWDHKWWKPGGKDLADYQRRLVKGIALGLAELDRVSDPDFVARHAAEASGVRREAIGLDGERVDVTAYDDPAAQFGSGRNNY